MPHIHTGPGEHDFTASALIIRLDTPKPELLLHSHKKFNKLMQPGGHIELTETPWQAILHEIIEETGYDPNQLELLQPKQRLRRLSQATLHPVAVCENTHAIGEDHWHTDRLYAFTTGSLPMHKPGENEATVFKWVTAEELERLPDSEVGNPVKEFGRYALTVVIREWERVPLSDFRSN